MSTFPASRPAAAKKFECPNCGGSVAVQAVGHSVSVACPSCGSILDVNNPQVAVLHAYEKQQGKVKAALPIGATGELAGATWQVVGFMQKKSLSYGYHWLEYLLFNPYLGYRFLSEYSGHWTLFETLPYFPKLNHKTNQQAKTEIAGQPHVFALYERNKAEVTFVMGEFYWRVKYGDVSLVNDFIAPPYGLSEETDASLHGREVNWSLGQYLDPEVVATAFGGVTLPAREGIGIHQPNPFKGIKRSIWIACIAAVVVLTGLQRWAASAAQVLPIEDRVQLLNMRADPTAAASAAAPSLDLSALIGGTIPVQPPPSDTTVSVAAFSLAAKTNALELKSYISPDFPNTEIEGEGTLVNTTTGESFPFVVWAYYASGFDSDGAWTETKQADPVMFYDLPAGKYTITYHLKAKSDNPLAPFRGKMTVDAVANPVSWANYLLALGLIVGLGWFMAYRERAFELRRWAESDFSPDA